MFKYEWTNENNVRLFWDGEEIGIYEQENDSKQWDLDGIPSGLKTFASDWVASQSVPDETKLQDAIEQLAAILANDFEEIEA